MTKLFRYELKRLIFNKFFLGFLLISVLLGYQIMSGDIILGVANTAPFSGWSYGTYLSRILPVLLVALLFFISLFYSKKEQQVQVLTDATPISHFQYRLLRYSAIVCAYLLVSIVPIALAFGLYGFWFHFTSFGDLLLPTLMTLFPAMLFILGVGLLAGEIHQSLVFALMLVVLLLSYIPMPYAADLLGGNFFTDYPATLNSIEPAFTVPTSVLIGRCVYGLVGLALIMIVMFTFNTRQHLYKK